MSDENIQLTIDGVPVSVPPETTTLQAAQDAGIEIPILCYFAHTTANGLCRLCVVEIENMRTLQAACVVKVQDGSVIHTRSEAVERVRKTILEMLAATVDLSESPELQDMLAEYNGHPERFLGGRRRAPEIMDDNPVFVRDYSQCVLCWRCVQVCADDAQFTYAINFGGRGFDTSIATYFNQPLPLTTCVFCGNCVGVCPTGALKSKRECLLEQGVAPQDIFAITGFQQRNKRSRGGIPLD